MRWLWSALVVLAAACTCPPGTADCDGDCVSLETDEDHCGACGSVCGGGGLCREGACVGGARSASPCSEDRHCANGSYCDGVERCVAGYCRPGRPVECDDGIECTRDSCDDRSLQCVSIPSDDRCGAGQGCVVLDGTSERGCR